MKELLSQLRQRSLDAIASAQEPEELEALRIKYLGKKGELTAILKQMGKLSSQERPVIGQLANDVPACLEAKIDERRKILGARMLERRLEAETLDVTIPGKKS